jgi:ribosomal protein S2
MLTNWSMIKKSMDSLNEIYKNEESGEINFLSKKEKFVLNKKKENMFLKNFYLLDIFFSFKY